MSQPVKEEFNHFKETCVFKPTAREEELLSKTVHPDELVEFIRIVRKQKEETNDRLETLEVRFNELCGLLHTQLANSSFLLLKIDEVSTK